MTVHKRRQSALKRRPRRLASRRPPPPAKVLPPKDLSGLGVLVRGEARREREITELPVTYGKLGLPYSCTLIWTPDTQVVPDAVWRGFARLQDSRDMGEPWEVLATLIEGEKLAGDVGSVAERKKTEAAVGDLRLPVYDTRVLWVRKTSATEKMVVRWRKELEAGADENHAFLRAVYGERVMLCTLPVGWYRC